MFGLTQCTSCDYRIGDSKLAGNMKRKVFSCLAFPNGIPIEILSGKLLHNKVIKGQSGSYVFSPSSNKELSLSIYADKTEEERMDFIKYCENIIVNRIIKYIRKEEKYKLLNFSELKLVIEIDENETLCSNGLLLIESEEKKVNIESKEFFFKVISHIRELFKTFGGKYTKISISISSRKNYIFEYDN